MPHTASDWDRWGGQRPRKESQLVALDVTKQPQCVVLLPPGGATEPLPGDLNRTPVNVRARRGDFHCLVPGCGAFEAAIAPANRRHHFRHSSAPPGGRPGHDPESADHNNAKHELAAWLRQTLGNHLVHLSVDERRIRTRHGTVKPDVYAEIDTGARIAIEYQHSPGDASVVDNKSVAYGSEGISCWWLFGPYQTTCQKTEAADRRDKDPAFTLTPVQSNLIRRGITFHWFSAEHRLIGTPFNLARRPIRPIYDNEDWGDGQPQTVGVYPQRPWPSSQWVLMNATALEACSINLESGDLLTPIDIRISQRWRAGDAEIVRLRAQARRRRAAVQEAVAAPPTEVGSLPVVADRSNEPAHINEQQQEANTSIGLDRPSDEDIVISSELAPDVANDQDDRSAPGATLANGVKKDASLPTAEPRGEDLSDRVETVAASPADKPRKAWWKRLLGIT